MSQSSFSVFNRPVPRGETVVRGSSFKAEAERDAAQEAASRLGPAKVLEIEESVRRRAERMP